MQVFRRFISSVGHLPRQFRICLVFPSFDQFSTRFGKETEQMVMAMGYAQALPAKCL